MNEAGLLADPTPIKRSAKIKMKIRGYEPVARMPVIKSLGCHVLNHALPRPDLIDPPSVRGGCEKRFCHAPPAPDVEKVRRFHDFVREYVEKHYTPIPPEYDMSFESWLDLTNYPEWRKKELREAYDRFIRTCDEDLVRNTKRAQSFIKDESYPTWKYPRPINSRSDEFKCATGPAFKAIEHVVFTDPSFIKKVPRSEWPEYVERTIKELQYIYCSDYSSFEALFEAHIMEVEMILYRWMLQNHPDSLFWVEQIAGTNECKFRYVDVTVEYTRLSGDMCTSLGNGFCAHMISRFVVHERYGQEVLILQEGDDTIFCSPGPITEADFEELGLEIKLDQVPVPSAGQFCQLLYDPDEMIVVRDPVKYVVSFGWCSGNYLLTDKYDRNLLICKALSCISQYPGHPILQPMAYWVLRCANFNDSRSERERLMTFVDRQRSMDVYVRQVYMSSLTSISIPDPKPITLSTRLLVESLFGVGLSTQFALEDWFRDTSEMSPIPDSLFGGSLQMDWALYYEWYVRFVRPEHDKLWKHVAVGPMTA
jgi:hypothetical protein